MKKIVILAPDSTLSEEQPLQQSPPIGKLRMSEGREDARPFNDFEEEATFRDDDRTAQVSAEVAIGSAVRAVAVEIRNGKDSIENNKEPVATSTNSELNEAFISPQPAATSIDRPSIKIILKRRPRIESSKKDFYTTAKPTTPIFVKPRGRRIEESPDGPTKIPFRQSIDISSDEVSAEPLVKKRKLVKKSDLIERRNATDVVMDSNEFSMSRESSIIDLDAEITKSESGMVRNGSAASVASINQNSDDLEIIGEVKIKSAAKPFASSFQKTFNSNTPAIMSAPVPIVITAEMQHESMIDRELLELLNESNYAMITECMDTTDEQTNLIIESRPKDSYQSWFEFCSLKGLARQLNKYREILNDLGSVDLIIKHCDMVARDLNRSMTYWNTILNCNSSAPSVVPNASIAPNGVSSSDIIADDPVELKDLSKIAAFSECISSQPECINDKMQLKDYQLFGVSWLLMLYEKNLGGILADEMGLGKTAQVIAFLGVLLSKGDPGPHLIIVPSSTLDNWMREIQVWCPSLTAITYSGSMEERGDLQYNILEDNDLNIVLTTYTIATGNSEDRKKFKTLFLDEGHMIKNGDSQRSKYLKKFKIPFKILITGTPLQNNLMELLSLLVFIMPELFLPARESFTAIFDINKNSRLEDEVSKRRLAHAATIMTPFVLRRKKDEVRNDIPLKTKIIELCQATKEQTELYREVMKVSKNQYKSIDLEVSTTVTKKKPTKKELLKSSQNMSNVLMQLRKVANHQLLMRRLYSDELIPSIAKDILKEVEFMESNLDFVIEDMHMMSDFELHTLCMKYSQISKYQLVEKDWMDTAKVHFLAKVLPVMRAKVVEWLISGGSCITFQPVRYYAQHPGGGDEDSWDQVPEIRWVYAGDSPEITVFLLSTKACGLGINLTSANTVILYDIDFNPHNDAQAEDRAHRVGQLRPVTVYKLIVEGTVEQHMLTCANFKLLLDDKVQDLDQAAGKKEEKEEPSDEGVLSLLRNDLEFFS